MFRTFEWRAMSLPELVLIPSSLGNVPDPCPWNISSPSAGLNPIKSGKCSGHRRTQPARAGSSVLIPSSLGNVPDAQIIDAGTIVSTVLIPSSLGNVPDKRVALPRGRGKVLIPSSLGNVPDAAVFMAKFREARVLIPSSLGNVPDFGPDSQRHWPPGLNPIKSGKCSGRIQSSSTSDGRWS